MGIVYTEAKQGYTLLRVFGTLPLQPSTTQTHPSSKTADKRLVIPHLQLTTDT